RAAYRRWSITQVGMPAALARARPAASARFEMTTRSSQSSRPAAIRSMIAWRLVPAPEISAPAATTPPFSAGVPEPSRGVRRERREVNRSPVALDRALAVGDDAHPAREPRQLAGLQDEGRVAGMAGGELRRRERLEEEEAARH